MPIATVIASDRLASGQISTACDYLQEAGLTIGGKDWIDAEYAADIIFTGDIALAKNALSPMLDEIDLVVQSSENRTKKLLISDMDSTMITVECIDELADYAGIKDQIAAVTEAAMRGELDFEEALRGRVALLKGLHEDNISQCLKERVRMSAGAKTLVQTMAARGAKCVLVSGGFTQFASSVANQLGFHEYHANILDINDHHMSGNIKGAIVDAQRKREILENIISQNNWTAAQSLAVGDGANDIPMIEASGLGAAYKAKPAAENAADMIIRHSDLTALLYAQGVKRSDWIC